MNSKTIISMLAMGTLIFSACGKDSDAADTTSGPATATNSAGDGDGDGDDDTGGDTVTTSATSGDGDGDGDDPCASFLGCMDVPEPIVMCDFWAQDCPDGEKCTAIASTPGEGAWDANVCVPAGTEAPGSTCTTMEGVDGADTCDGTGMCYDFDQDTGEGTCVEFCVGTPESNTCPQTGHDCKQLNSGVLNLCLPSCNPLNAGECPPGQVCVAAYEGDTLGGFICFPPAAEGISGEQCECANCCAEGHLCTDAATYGTDCAFDLCCTEYCDTSDSTFACQGAGQQCVPLFEETDPNFANVGGCQIPV